MMGGCWKRGTYDKNVKRGEDKKFRRCHWVYITTRFSTYSIEHDDDTGIKWHRSNINW